VNLDPTGPGVPSRLFRGYGPLLGLVLVLVLVATFFPTRAQEVRVEQLAAAGDAVTDVEVLGASVEGTETTLAPTDAPAEAATTPTAAGAAAPAATAPAAGRGTRPGAPAATGDAARGRTPCPGATRQVPNDPYSPPCFQWSGTANGGATAKGVTATDIVVSVRIDAFLGGLTDALAKAAGARELKEDPKVVERTLDTLVEFFNRNYQFYGRKIRLAKYSGKGDLLKEALGGGQEGAEQDAIRVAEEIGAFADVSAISPVYADALSRRRVVNIGVPYPSRQWLAARRPYAWSSLADCTTISSSVSSYYLARLAGRPATLAGGDLQGQPRRIAVIAPDNESYRQCAESAVEQIRKAGFGQEIALDERYVLDLNAMPSQAAALTPKIKAAKATTIVCACDPVMLVFLTSKVREQGMQPEWVNTGVAFSDQDLVGQLMDPASWSRNFGISFAGPVAPLRGSIAYAAYKSIRADEPSVTAELVYYQLQMLAIGIQMAGPNLTPETFEAGMFDYPTSSGRAGTWAFGPNDYATAEDAREIYWDPSTASTQNGLRGAYAETMPAKRFTIGSWPTGDPAVPRR